MVADPPIIADPPTIADAPIIHIEGLVKRFGDLTAVDDLHLEVPSGTMFGFLGPNGAGKTTTLKMLTGLMRPTAGSASVAGFDIVDAPLEVVLATEAHAALDEAVAVDGRLGVGLLQHVAHDPVGVIEVLHRRAIMIWLASQNGSLPSPMNCRPSSWL